MTLEVPCSSFVSVFSRGCDGRLGFWAIIVEEFVMMSAVLHVAVLHKNTVQHVSPGPEISTIMDSFAACLCWTVLRYSSLSFCFSMQRGSFFFWTQRYQVADVPRPSVLDSPRVCVGTKARPSVLDSPRVCVGTKSFCCAEVLFVPKTSEFPDGHNTTVGAKRWRSAQVLCLSKICEFLDDIFVVGVRRFAVVEVLFQPGLRFH